jgi:hypothetical protein
VGCRSPAEKLQQNFDSVKDRQNRHIITAKYANLAEASRPDIEIPI